MYVCFWSLFFVCIFINIIMKLTSEVWRDEKKQQQIEIHLIQFSSGMWCHIAYPQHQPSYLLTMDKTWTSLNCHFRLTALIIRAAWKGCQSATVAGIQSEGQARHVGGTKSTTGTMYPSISPITMWISNCRLKYEQYKYTTYITSRVIMLTFIMHALHYWNSMCGPAVQALQWHMWSSCPSTALPQWHVWSSCPSTALLPWHVWSSCSSATLFEQHVWSSCSSTALLEQHVCGPAVQALHYCNGTPAVQLSKHCIIAMAHECVVQLFKHCSII